MKRQTQLRIAGMLVLSMAGCASYYSQPYGYYPAGYYDYDFYSPYYYNFGIGYWPYSVYGYYNYPYYYYGHYHHNHGHWGGQNRPPKNTWSKPWGSGRRGSVGVGPGYKGGGGSWGHGQRGASPRAAMGSGKRR